MADEASKTDVQLRDGKEETDTSSLPSTAREEVTEEKGHETAASPSPEGPQEGDALNDYLTGPKLVLLLAATGLIFFVLLLDNSIISTVSGGLQIRLGWRRLLI